MQDIEVVEKMPDAQYESVCDAGVALVDELHAVLRRYGLAHDQAFNVLVVAAAGVSAPSELTSAILAECVDHVIHMWRIRDVEGGREAIFDPTYMRPIVPVRLDPMSVN